MSLKLGGHLFTGPFPIETTAIRENQAPVVYAIISKSGPAWAPSFRVIDVGYSEDAGIRFADLPQSAAWVSEQATVYLYYTPRSSHPLAERRRLSEELREKYQPPHEFVGN